MADQEMSGEAIRFDFWRKMFLPLAALLFAGSNHMTAFACMFVIACILYVIALCRAFFKFVHWFQMSLHSYPAFAVQVIGLPFLLYKFLPHMLAIQSYTLPHARVVNGTKESTVISVDTSESSAWEAVFISAALTYTILVYCLSTSRQKECPIPWVYHVLMAFTVIALYFATGAEWVKIEYVVVYFKIASLVLLLCCAPHLYPGLDHRRSSCVVKFFVICVLPLTLVVFRLLMKYEYTSNAAVIAEVDECKFWTGASYAMFFFWDKVFDVMDKYEEENESDDDSMV